MDEFLKMSIYRLLIAGQREGCCQTHTLCQCSEPADEKHVLHRINVYSTKSRSSCVTSSVCQTVGEFWSTLLHSVVSAYWDLQQSFMLSSLKAHPHIQSGWGLNSDCSWDHWDHRPVGDPVLSQFQLWDRYQNFFCMLYFLLWLLNSQFDTHSK